MNYYNTFIQVAPDTNAKAALVPVAKAGKKTIAVLEYEIISGNPYAYTQEEVQFAVHCRPPRLKPCFYRWGEHCMQKLDLKKKLKHLYQASPKQVVEVEVPRFKFLMIDGIGDPNTSKAYAEAVEALFSVSYATKFKVRNELKLCDYAVMPLEGLWWADDMSAFASGDRENWQWTMMIMQPDFVDNGLIEAAIAETRKKKRLPAVDKLRVEEFTEGRCAQILHVGPFAEEGPTIERLHQYIKERSSLAGKHHEIYLTDVRRADPKNWKTILRQPMLRQTHTTGG